MRLHLRLGLVAIALLSAGACASTGKAVAGNRQLEVDAKRALSAYVDCAYIHADAMARDRGAPEDVADAAVAHCERRHAQYCAAATAYLESVASPDDQSHAQERGEAGCIQTRDDTREALVGRVVRERELASERLERAMDTSRDRPPTLR